MVPLYEFSDEKITPEGRSGGVMGLSIWVSY